MSMKRVMKVKVRSLPKGYATRPRALRFSQVVRKALAAKAVSFTPATVNRKLAPIDLQPTKQRPRPVPRGPFVASTASSIQATCPEACIFKRRRGVRHGCYSDSGFTRIAGAKMDEAGGYVRADEVAVAEAGAIDRAFKGGRIPQDSARGGRDLRLHVGGDVRTTRSATVLGEAATRWVARGGGTVWTYTHAWRTVPRSAWGSSIQVIASVERAEEIDEARRLGYPAAIVLEALPDDGRAFALEGEKVVPCPFESKGTTCAGCRLCLDRDLGALGITIGFAIHGRDSVAARRSLALKVVG